MGYDQGTSLCLFNRLNPGKLLLDKEDYEKYKWNKVSYNDSLGYVKIWLEGKSELLHRAIMGFPKGRLDHKNQNRLDCRKENLRLATPSQNGQNQGVRVNNTSGYKGVSWHSRDKVWQARIRKGHSRYHLGYFDCPKKAAEAYNKKAVEFFGEFACLNEL